MLFGVSRVVRADALSPSRCAGQRSGRATRRIKAAEATPAAEESEITEKQSSPRGFGEASVMLNHAGFAAVAKLAPHRPTTKRFAASRHPIVSLNEFYNGRTHSKLPTKTASGPEVSQEVSQVRPLC